MFDSQTAACLQATACFVEAEVAGGRAVEEVLAVGRRHVNNFWMNPSVLRHYSPSVAKFLAARDEAAALEGELPAPVAPIRRRRL